MSLCETCGGAGRVPAPNEAAYYASDPCPAGCYRVKLPIGVYLGPGGNPQIGYLDRNKTLLWCETHRSVARRPTDACEARLLAARKAYDRLLSEHDRRENDTIKNEACNIVPYEMPTDPLGELA